MQQLTLPLEKSLPIGVVVAVNISREDYLQNYMDGRYEWIEGVVIAMSPVTLKHDAITDFIRSLLKAYLALIGDGKIVGDPFVMRTATSFREPDVQVILGENIANLKNTYMDGPADICIEVVSEESTSRDYGEKFAEYEKAGVREYWIIDPKHQRTTFYRLDSAGSYQHIALDSENNYRTPLLAKFYLPVTVLWQEELPDYFAIGDMVKAMFAN